MSITSRLGTRLPQREDIVAYGYFAGWSLVRRLPLSLTRKAFDKLADAVSKKGTGPEQLRKNLARVVGPENVTKQLLTHDATRR